MSDKDKVLIDAIAQDVSTFFLDENAEYNLETLPRIIALHVSPALATVRKEVWKEVIQESLDFVNEDLFNSNVLVLIEQHLKPRLAALERAADGKEGNDEPAKE